MSNIFLIYSRQELPQLISICTCIFCIKRLLCCLLSKPMPPRKLIVSDTTIKSFEQEDHIFKVYGYTWNLTHLYEIYHTDNIDIDMYFICVTSISIKKDISCFCVSILSKPLYKLIQERQWSKVNTLNTYTWNN